jgi:DnaJ-class molecular chaperone
MIQKERIYTTAKCAWCNGSRGYLGSPGRNVSCIVCGGKGHLSIEVPAEACLDCSGNGKGKGTLACHACAGTGWQYYLRKRATPAIK